MMTENRQENFDVGWRKNDWVNQKKLGLSWARKHLYITTWFRMFWIEILSPISFTRAKKHPNEGTIQNVFETDEMLYFHWWKKDQLSQLGMIYDTISKSEMRGHYVRGILHFLLLSALLPDEFKTVSFYPLDWREIKNTLDHRVLRRAAVVDLARYHSFCYTTIACRQFKCTRI